MASCVQLAQSGWHVRCGSGVRWSPPSAASLALRLQLRQGYIEARPGGQIVQSAEHRCLQLRAHASSPRIDNYELLIGDIISLISFCIYKQISALVLNPAFEGWFAPLKFNPVRFVEFASFTMTIVGAWVAASLIMGAYRAHASSDLPTVLRVTSTIWLVSMPVAAAQLVLTTAAASSALVGDEGFAMKLPLAASLPGEPFVTAAGVLGVMAIWRSFHACYLDRWGLAARRGPDLTDEVSRFREALQMVGIMAAVSMIIIQVMQLVMLPEDVEALTELVNVWLHRV